MKKTKTKPEETLEERFARTVPAFQTQINRIAAVNDLDPMDVFAKWRAYCDTCSNWDQSPILSEFVQWEKLDEPGPRCSCELKLGHSGPVPHCCPEHDGDYSAFLAACNCD